MTTTMKYQPYTHRGLLHHMVVEGFWLTCTGGAAKKSSSETEELAAQSTKHEM